MSELRDAEISRDTAARGVASQETTVATLERHIAERRTALEVYKGDVERYLMNHKMAVAVIAGGLGGGAVALSPGNEFSDEAKQIAGIVGVVAAIWAASNASEVAEVVDQMNQASSNVKTIESQILDAEKKRDEANTSLAGYRSELESTQVKVIELRQRLNVLVSTN